MCLFILYLFLSLEWKNMLALIFDNEKRVFANKKINKINFHKML